MKISALIAKLERVKTENGDINLHVIARNGKGVIDVIPYNPDIKYSREWPLRKPHWLIKI